MNSKNNYLIVFKGIITLSLLSVMREIKLSKGFPIKYSSEDQQ
ncbi:hypothetical protein DR95_2010 [Proteus vulgaris]|nr:hypothetical protein DR95_2010 [Proteus vulgaris]